MFLMSGSDGNHAWLFADVFSSNEGGFDRFYSPKNGRFCIFTAMHTLIHVSRSLAYHLKMYFNSPQKIFESR